MEEDYVGHMVKMLKGAVHTKTLGLRSLQRWLLQYNCKMAPRENMSAASISKKPEYLTSGGTLYAVL